VIKKVKFIMAINYGISTDYINFSNTNSLTGLITSNLIYAFDAARSRSYSLGVTTSDLNGTAVVGTLTGGVVFDYLNLGSHFKMVQTLAIP
jgi:hypothetical protein